MAEAGSILPPCGHTDRNEELTEIEVRAAREQSVMLLVCTVRECPEFCRVFADLRDCGAGNPHGNPADRCDLVGLGAKNAAEPSPAMPVASGE